MFQVQLHLVSGEEISADLDPPLIDKLIGELLALPGVVPRLLIQLPTRDELEDRAARLRLVAVALGALLAEKGTLNFLAQEARAVVIDRAAIAGIEVVDPEQSMTGEGRGPAAARNERQVAVGSR
jgi:hypothetical protein